MKNGPIFEWSTGNIILDYQENKKYFDRMINDLQHHHNADDNSNCVPDNSDGDDNSLGSWEEEYSSMDKEEGTIVAANYIARGEIYDLRSTINVQAFFQILQETRAHENPTNHRQSKQT